jgi:hypothetical protein
MRFTASATDMEKAEILEKEPEANSYSAEEIPSFPKLQTREFSGSIRQDLRQDFFGTKVDKQKSLFVSTMILLILAFFILSSVSLSLDVLTGLVLLGYGIYGGIRWTRHFLKEFV